MVSTIEVPFPLNNTGKAKPRAIDLDESGSNLIVGTAASEIYKIEVHSEGGILKSSGPQAAELLVTGHHAPKNKDTNEVWGLCAIPKTGEFVSVSDDATLRVWSASERKQVKLIDLNLRAEGQALPPDPKTKELSWAAQARSVDVSADGGHVAVGFRNGEVRVYRTQDWKLLRTLKKPMAADEWIEDLKFSPDGNYLAVSSHDNKVYVFNSTKLELFCTLKGSSSFITHLDWSQDSRFIRTNDGSYELLFYAVKQGNQAPHAGSALRDTAWQTSTCPISWATQGIWGPGYDGTDINHCDVSEDAHPDGYQILATGDDFGRVKLYRYPSMVEPSKAITLRGHSSHVTKVKFNGKYLFSTGGNDATVI